ncbi:MAG: putative LPS assembly protein LptD [Leeuwenhoekiella sp.]
MRTNYLTLMLLVGIGLLCSQQGFGQDLPNNDTKIRKVEEAIPTEKVTINDSLIIDVPARLYGLNKIRNTSETVNYKKEQLQAIVNYTASDYSRFDRESQRLYLYNQAEIKYTDINITAGQIMVDNKTNTVFAKGIKDSTGTYTQGPVFVQGANEVKPDSILYNIATEKAIIYGSRTQQGEFNVISEVSKRVNDSVVFLRNVKFTTSNNVDNPEYYFYGRRVKLVPGKKIVTGLVNMFIADVPTPLGIPFSYFPLEKEESVSGFIIPSPGESNQRGYFLQNGGYYFALSDYYDLTLTGDYYTNGSYALGASSSYKKRYKFNGRFNLRYERILNSERGLPDFSETNTYNVQWNHTQDTKASPNSRFSAMVNLGSSNFFQQSINSNNIGNRIQNNFSSSVSYSKVFPVEPQVDLSLTATHSQNSQTGNINMTLPTLQLNVGRVFPFAPKNGSKKGIIQNINLNYSVRGENSFLTNDQDFFTAKMFRDAELGLRHSIPITTNFKLFKYLSVSAGSSYQESWVFKTIDQSFDAENNQIVTDTVPGFDAFRTYNLNGSIGTTIYGNFDFGTEGKIQKIRHVIKPSVSYNYNPAFDQFYETFLARELNDPTGDLTREVTFSRFEGGFYNPPSRSLSSGLGININQTIEAKVRDKDSTATEPKKIMLLNNFSIATNYNFAADSLKLSAISVRGTFPIIQQKLSVNFAMRLDPYALNNNNRPINKLNIENGGSLFRLTAASANFGYSFSSETFSKKTDNDDPLENDTFANGGRTDGLFGKGIDEINGEFYEDERNALDEDDDEDQELYNYTLPWNLRVNYNVNYGNAARQDQITSHAINFSGDVELGKKWSVGASSGIDLTDFGITPTQLRFRRDLESFNMTFSWTPFGDFTSWNFFIGITSSVLSDLKYEERSVPDQRF